MNRHEQEVEDYTYIYKDHIKSCVCSLLLSTYCIDGDSTTQIIGFYDFNCEITETKKKKKVSVCKLLAGILIKLETNKGPALPPMKAQRSKPDIVNSLYLPKSTTNLRQKKLPGISITKWDGGTFGLVDQVFNKG